MCIFPTKKSRLKIRSTDIDIPHLWLKDDSHGHSLSLAKRGFLNLKRWQPWKSNGKSDCKSKRIFEPKSKFGDHFRGLSSSRSMKIRGSSSSKSMKIVIDDWRMKMMKSERWSSSSSRFKRGETGSCEIFRVRVI